MPLRFLGFLSRALQAGPSLSIENRPSPKGALNASDASRWASAHGSDPEDNPSPRPAKKGSALSTRLLVGAALAHLVIVFSPYLAFPIVDRALRPDDYRAAGDALDRARAAGFFGAPVTLGGWEASVIIDEYQASQNPKQKSPHGDSSASVFPKKILGPVNFLPDDCFVRVGASQPAPLLPSRKSDLQFTALHEISHCDQAGSLARFSPSAGELGASEARALRLIMLAGDRSQNTDALLSAARFDASVSPAEAERWTRIALVLFGESFADARALLMLSRLEPQSWRDDGWAIWLERSVGLNGAARANAHTHATEDALAMALSVPDKALAQLTPEGLSELAAGVASDALALKLAKQNWHQRFDPARLPSAVARALSASSDLPASSAHWRQGPLPALGFSPESLKADLQWLQSNQSSAAFTRLFERMRQTRDNAIVPRIVERSLEGVSIRYAIEPSAGSFDLRHEGSELRSISAWALSSAALLNRAGAMAPTASLAQGPLWEALRAGDLPNHPILKQLAQRPSGQPVYFGRARGIGAPYAMASSLEKLAAQELALSSPLALSEQRPASRP